MFGSSLEFTIKHELNLDGGTVYGCLEFKSQHKITWIYLYVTLFSVLKSTSINSLKLVRFLGGRL